jgi:hypothetical protein
MSVLTPMYVRYKRSELYNPGINVWENHRIYIYMYWRVYKRYGMRPFIFIWRVYMIIYRRSDVYIYRKYEMNSFLQDVE